MSKHEEMDDHGDGSTSDLDEQEFSNKKERDTTVAEVRKGRDVQGIPWEGLSITREKYHKLRIEQYKNYENVHLSGEMLGKECKHKQKGGEFYEFRHNSRSVKPTILHFQLRNLAWATSKHDVNLMSGYSLVHWNAITSERSQVMNFQDHEAPTVKHIGSLLEGFTQTQFSTLAVKDRLVVAGGLQRELICKISFISTTLSMDMTEQQIDFFGKVAGISFSPDTESFFVGVWDRTYG